MINDFKELIGKQVERFIVVVFPPFGEENFSQVDISAGFIFKGEPEKLCVISTDKNYLERPIIYNELPPKDFYEWNIFYLRMKEWMNGPEDWVIDTEYYDVTESSEFKHIVNNSILDVQLVFQEQEEIPFGVKVIFENDILLSTPIIDGNTFETLFFNKQNNIEVFRSFGNILFRSVKEL